MQAFAKQSKPSQVLKPAPTTVVGKQVSGQGHESSEPENIENAPANQAFTTSNHSFSRVPVFANAPAFIQPKLTINTPGDPYEQEADQMAEKVMRMEESPSLISPNDTPPDDTIQRKCSDCEEEEKEEPLMRKAQNGGGFQALPSLASQLNTTKGGGSPLPEETKSGMQKVFNTDFSKVRVHTDRRAADMSAGIQAKAFTHGRDIYFNSGEYAPESSAGKRLLAHELTHTVQQENLFAYGDDIQRDVDEETSSGVQSEQENPLLPEEMIEQRDYAFIFTGGAYGRSAEAFIRQYYPQHRLVRSTSFEAMFDRLYSDIRGLEFGERFHLRELIIVTHANAAGGLQIPLTRGDVAVRRFFNVWDVDNLQEEFQSGLHQRFRQRRHELVSTIIDEDTTVTVRGCEFGQATEALEVLRSLFGGQPTVWAPRAYQGYETIPIGSSLLRTPEEAFDFLMQQDFLPPELMPLPEEDKRTYIGRVFGLNGTIPAEFFIVGSDARTRLQSLIESGESFSQEAEREKLREPATLPSVGEYWSQSSPGLGDDAEFDQLSMREIAQRANTLMNSYRPENACTIARLRDAWERKEFNDSYWQDYFMSENRDPLAGLPGETTPFFAYMANRFRSNPSDNPFNGLSGSIFGDSNIIAIDSSRYPCSTPHEDIFETRMLNYEIPDADSNTFEDTLVVNEEPTSTSSSVVDGSARGTAGEEGSRSEALASRTRALDFSKSQTPNIPEPSLEESLQRLSDEDLTEAYRLALELAMNGDWDRLTAVETEMQRRLVIGPYGGIDITSFSEAEFETISGIPIASIPEQTAIVGGPGVGILFIPQPNWYYRVLVPGDPSIARIQSGAHLTPRPVDSGFNFQDAGSRAEMTFRHTRPGGNVPMVGTDRISTAQALEAFETLLRDRGTGEMVRVDVPAVRRFGSEFLEHPEILADLNQMEQAILSELEQARQVGRGRSHIERIEGRLRALRHARDYTVAFQEGHAVGRVPSQSITPVEGAILSEAVAGEQAFLRNIRFLRWGGRVLIVVGAGLSLHRIATATPDERPRVTSQEAGGWALSAGGAWAGAEAGAVVGGLLGIESGPGLLITGGIGAIIGGGIGFFVGEEVADRIYSILE